MLRYIDLNLLCFHCFIQRLPLCRVLHPESGALESSVKPNLGYTYIAAQAWFAIGSPAQKTCHQSGSGDLFWSVYHFLLILTLASQKQIF